MRIHLTKLKKFILMFFVGVILLFFLVQKVFLPNGRFEWLLSTLLGADGTTYATDYNELSFYYVRQGMTMGDVLDTLGCPLVVDSSEKCGSEEVGDIKRSSVKLVRERCKTEPKRYCETSERGRETWEYTIHNDKLENYLVREFEFDDEIVSKRLAYYYFD